MNEFKLALSNYTNFNGRATRREFWMFVLFYFIFYFVASILGFVLAIITESAFLAMLPTLALSLGLLLPYLAVSVRRLHDVDKSGWFLLLSIIPFVGFYILYLFCIEGNSNTNQWGSSRNVRASNSF
jgi:uncharacterized membrane protein YhaH (DUF805 family)